jgi:hypothetical protein
MISVPVPHHTSRFAHYVPSCHHTPFPPRRRTGEETLSNHQEQEPFLYAIASTIAFKVVLGRMAFDAFSSLG